MERVRWGRRTGLVVVAVAVGLLVTEPWGEGAVLWTYSRQHGLTVSDVACGLLALVGAALALVGPGSPA